ncbi:unnamed protein product [Symbiodinium pilosum]|uniref:Uncharacterized protein n=1 Tax=Symbiodinium pilosum TaxID=2952 RepID=A0A812VH80_SYMPI|nr:unnamed protein product [Symbiodinium pilosum]
MVAFISFLKKYDAGRMSTAAWRVQLAACRAVSCGAGSNFHHHYKRHHEHNGESDEHEHGQLKTDKGGGPLDENEDKEQAGEEAKDEGEVEGEGEKDGEEGEEEEEAWNMTLGDKLLLEIGWLGLFLVLSMALVALMGIVSQLRDDSKDIDDGIVEPSAFARGAYWIDVHLLDPLVIVMGLANFVVFAASTELDHDKQATSGFGFKRKLVTWVPRANELWSPVSSFVGSSTSLVEGSAAPFVALLLNAYAWIDMIAMMPSLLDIVFHKDVRLC